MRNRATTTLMRAIRRPVTGTGILLCLATSGILLTTQIAGLPTPRIHDEFAYLLTADTFAQGRLTNPTHPFWPHFETFQVIHQPTYQAKYPPTQGLFLAAGIALGHPVFGVWVGVLLMIACIAWGLRGLLSPEWAFFGALLAILSLGIASYWAHSYWGGAVAAAGGALVFGFSSRMIRGPPRLTDGLLGGIGLMLLANTRPLEGLIFTMAAAIWIGVARLRRHRASRVSFAAPLSALILGLVGVGLVAGYNQAVTGNFLTFPYVVHEWQYALAPTLLVHPPREAAPEYRHAEMERFYEVWDRQRHRLMREQGFIGYAWRATALPAAIGPAAVLLLFVPFVWGTTGVKFALGSIVAVGLPVLFTKAAFPHYFAPALVSAYFLIAVVTRRLLSTMKEHLLGKPLIGAIMLVSVLDPVHQVGVRLSSDPTWSDRRHEVLQRLRSEAGRDLVIVHYPTTHPAYQEWVYNRADIDASEVVWARSMGPAADSSLVAYFDDRRIWQLDVTDPPVLTEIRPAGASGP